MVPASLPLHVKSRLRLLVILKLSTLFSFLRKPHTCSFSPFPSLLSRGRLGDWALQLSTPIDFVFALLPSC
ncbi:uncharacterized protein B0T15DRAFT_201262 [Chaetomium strumarium]|uniref:Uncharacterized protein n=1 Tax=Chaetomium strumarium TaxID=1170767 RepID=A0AAJ0GSX0_9PEZI|nr:hypothetical protein B0T15DRAFT_201262 [Chaetomium strumarium]